MVGGLDTDAGGDERFVHWRQKLESMYAGDNFSLVSEETFKFRERPAGAYRFLFDRYGTRLQASLLWVPLQRRRMIWLDAGGLPKHMAKHRDALETVLSTMTFLDG
jgi:hypothetical protein